MDYNIAETHDGCPINMRGQVRVMIPDKSSCFANGNQLEKHGALDKFIPQELWFLNVL